MAGYSAIAPNAVPQKAKQATKFGVKLFKGGLIKFLFCNKHNLLKTGMFVYIFFASKCRQLLVTFAKHFVLQNGFSSSKSSKIYGNMEVDELNKCPAKFYVSVRKTDDSYYKRTNLLSIRAALDRHLKAQPNNKSKAPKS